MEKTKNKKYKCKEEVNSKEECKCKDDCHCDETELKLKETEDKLLRLQAEFMNYQNRREKELETLFKYEGESIQWIDSRGDCGLCFPVLPVHLH